MKGFNDTVWTLIMIDVVAAVAFGSFEGLCDIFKKGVGWVYTWKNKVV